MGTSSQESETQFSDDERIRALEETIAYMQRDNVLLLKKLEAVMTDVANTKKRIDLWPFVKVAVK